MKLAKRKIFATGMKTYHMRVIFDAEFENQFHFSDENYFDHDSGFLQFC